MKKRMLVIAAAVAATTMMMTSDCTSLSTYRGLAMSSKVDPAIVEYWDKIMEKVCEDPDFIAEADNMGLVIRFQNTDEALKTFSEYNPIWYDLKESLGM